MYTSKELCFKNSRNFLCIDDDYDKKKEVDKRYRDKQFQTKPLLKGQTVGCFDTFKYSTDDYQDNCKYITSEPPNQRKNGFGSGDARRRDEFSKDVRARQWREKLKAENIYAQTALRNFRANTAKPMSRTEIQTKRQREYREKYGTNVDMFQTQVPWNLYDIGKDCTTPICNKCPREKFYCPHRIGRGASTLRRPGTAPTSAETYGDFVTPAEKPKFGVVSEHKSFYDNSHLTTNWSS